MKSNLSGKPTDPDIAEVERLIHEQRYLEVLTALQSHPRIGALGLDLRLYSLLASVSVHSCAGHEREIEEMIKTDKLLDNQKQILRQIFIVGFEEATEKGLEDTARIYQRLARRLVLGQPLGEVSLSHERDAPVQAELESLRERREESVRNPSSDSILRSVDRQRAWRIGLLLLQIAAFVGIIVYELREVKRPAPVLEVLNQASLEPALPDLTLVNSADTPLDTPAETQEEPSQDEPKVARTVKVKSDARELDPSPAHGQILPIAIERPRDRLKEAQGKVKIRLSVPLREEPRFGAPTVATIGTGAIANVIDSQGDWLEVRTEAGDASGYLRREFTVPLQPESPP
jgi:hypothetical protein